MAGSLPVAVVLARSQKRVPMHLVPECRCVWPLHLAGNLSGHSAVSVSNARFALSSFS